MPAMQRTAFVLVGAVALLLAACGGHTMNAPPVGFLSQPALMRKSSDGSWNYSAKAVDWANYKSVFVPVVTFADGAYEDNVWASAADLPTLSGKLQSALQAAMGSRYAAAAGAGAGTLVVRAQIVKAVPNAPARNLAPQTQIGGTGYGYGEVAIEVVDGGDGRVLLEFADVQSTTRFSTEKLTVWGSFEKSIGEWADRIANSCQAK